MCTSTPISRYLFIADEAIYTTELCVITYSSVIFTSGEKISKPKRHVWLSYLLMSFLFSIGWRQEGHDYNALHQLGLPGICFPSPPLLFLHRYPFSF